MSTLNYWAHRLMPLHDPAPGYRAAGEGTAQAGKEVVFVACNRVGTESGKFSGVADGTLRRVSILISWLATGARYNFCRIICSIDHVG